MLDISYRVRNLIIAGALAACAVALMFIYASHAKSHAAASSAASVSVLVATRDIPVGTTGAKLATGHWLVTRKLPGNSIASGAVTNPAQLASLVAIQPTYAGEQIVTRRFGTTQQEGLPSTFKGASRVIQLPGDANQLLSGALKEGNRVDVVGNVQLPEGGQLHSTVIALRDLLVVKAPTSTSSTNANGQMSVELQLTGDQAQRLFWLQKNGDWTLVLRPSNHAADKRGAPATAATIVEASNGR